jgi:hypothetical protein
MLVLVVLVIVLLVPARSVVMLVFVFKRLMNVFMFMHFTVVFMSVLMSDPWVAVFVLVGKLVHEEQPPFIHS